MMGNGMADEEMVEMVDGRWIEMRMADEELVEMVGGWLIENGMADKDKKEAMLVLIEDEMTALESQCTGTKMLDIQTRHGL